MREAFNQAVDKDLSDLRQADAQYRFSGFEGEFSTQYLESAMDGDKFQFLTVSLLLKLLEMFESQAAGASNVFLGADVPELQLAGMTLHKGRKAAQKYREVLIHVDEVPIHDKSRPDPFLQCLFLRNIIRCLGLPCLLSGTESTLFQIVEYGSSGSRIQCDRPWVWLLNKFPAMQLDGPLLQLTQRCTEYERHLLQRTRPLFVHWFAACTLEPRTDTSLAMTPAMLSHFKRLMTTNRGCTDNETAWLHSSLLLVFTDSLQRHSGEVSDNVSIDSAAQVGAKRSASSSGPTAPRKKQKMVVRHVFHSILISKHFALLSIPTEMASRNGMTALRCVDTILRDSNNNELVIRAAFKKCAKDPLLYLAGLRDGIVCSYDHEFKPVSVPSSFAFRTFRTQSGVRNRNATSNNGMGLEAECMAAMVLAAHRYKSFSGTPFFVWLALLVAELSHKRDFELTQITVIPDELRVALENVMVPLLSPPNSPWGEVMDSAINFADLSWCPKVAGSTEVKKQGEEEAEGQEDEEQCLIAVPYGYTNGAEFKDIAQGLAGEKKVAENSVSLLIGSNLKSKTVEWFDVSVYRMSVKGAIVRVSPPQTHWEAGRKVLIALDLKELYPDRAEALPHGI